MWLVVLCHRHFWWLSSWCKFLFKSSCDHMLEFGLALLLGIDIRHYFWVFFLFASNLVLFLFRTTRSWSLIGWWFNSSYIIKILNQLLDRVYILWWTWSFLNLLSSNHNFCKFFISGNCVNLLDFFIFLLLNKLKL